MTTPLTGLSQAEAEKRRAQGQGNHAPLQTNRTYWQIIRENVFTFINNALFLLGLALVLLGRPMDAVISVSVIMINVIVSVVQEIRAKRTLDRIALLTRPTATILRDGKEIKADPNEIVLGDVLRVSAGDQIVVDGAVVEGKMDTDESLLTGESDLIPKQPGDPVYSGSFCVSGSTLFEAQKVGNQSLANQLTSGARAYRRVLTPLQKQISLVIRVLLLLMLYLQILLVANTTLNRIPLVDSVKMSVVIAGLVPNGLFLAIAVAYALGAVRIAGKGALVQQSNAMESLSNVTVLCLDKTGTLTANRILFHSVFPYQTSEAELRKALGDFTASVSAGNRTNEAILTSCPGERLPISGEVDFSSQRKWSGLVFAGESRRGAYVLGAPEMLQNNLTGGLAPLQGRIDEAAEAGLRVLLLARAPECANLLDEAGQPRLPEAMQPMGLAILSDELRSEAGSTLADFARSGVRLKIISGDNPATVAALARQAGLKSAVKLVSGLELDGLSPSELAKKAEEGDVFGRITPSQKEELVRALRAQGHYVAMIGDGVNDVLSLKQANLGVAMQSGSQAARGVADIILLNDSFGALPVAVREGQRIINGMQDILKLFLTRVFVTALLVLSVEIVGGFPFSPRHSSLLALVTVGIPTLALAAWAQPGPPRKNLVRWLMRFTIPASLTISIMGLAVYILTLGWRTNWSAGDAASSPALLAAQTALTIFTILCGLILIPFVEPPTRFFTGGDRLSGDRRPTYMAIGLGILFFALLAVPFFASMFDIVPLEWWEYLGLAVFTVLWAFICRWTWRNRLIDRFFYTDLG